MGAAQAAYGQAGLPAGAPAVELVAAITQPLNPAPSITVILTQLKQSWKKIRSFFHFFHLDTVFVFNFLNNSF